MMVGFSTSTDARGSNMSTLILGTFFAVCAVFFMLLGFRIFKADPNEYEANRKLTKSIANGMCGNVSSFHGAERTSRVRNGMSINREGKLRPKAKLTPEATDAIICS